MIKVLKYLLRAVLTLFSNSKLFIYSLVPAVLAGIIFLISFSFAITKIAVIENYLFGGASWWLSSVYYLLTFCLILIAIGLISIILAVLLSGYFIELFVLELLKSKNLKPKIVVNYKQALFRAIFDELRLLVFVILLSILVVLFSFIPPLLIVSMLLAAFMAGFEVFDLPLQLLGYKWKDRVNYLKSRKLIYLQTGIIFSLILLIPILNFFALHIAYIMAVEHLNKDQFLTEFVNK